MGTRPSIDPEGSHALTKRLLLEHEERLQRLERYLQRLRIKVLELERLQPPRLSPSDVQAIADRERKGSA